jgi:hypothetical protein
MIKVIVRVSKPLDLEISEEDFYKGITGVFKQRIGPHYGKGRYHVSRTIKKDEIGRWIHESVFLFSDRQSADEFFDGPYSKKRVAQLEAAGYKRKVYYYELSPEFEKEYLESLTLDNVENDVFERDGDKRTMRWNQGPCQSNDPNCKCKICEWNRNREMPDRTQKDKVPEKLESIQENITYYDEVAQETKQKEFK